MEAIEYELWKQAREQQAAERKAERAEKREAEKDKLKRHVMGWVVPCGKHFFGPPPCCDGDLYYLRKTTRVSGIVSLKPLTGRCTRRHAFDTSTWYREMLVKKGPRDASGEPEEKLKVYTVPFDASGLPSMSDDEVIEAYVKVAKQIHKQYGKRERLYFHHTDGFTHEGYIAMALWRLQTGRGDKVPTDPVEWLKEQGHLQVFKMTAEKKLMRAVWARVKTISTGIRAMFAAQRARQKDGKSKGEAQEPVQKKRKKQVK